MDPAHASQPPPGIQYGDNIQKNCYAAWIISYFLAASAFGLRLWSRRLSGTKYGWDDWLIFLAFLAGTAQLGIGAWWLHIGGGKDIGVLTEHKLKQAFVIVYITEILYGLVLFHVRASALALWDRLFPKKRVRWYCWFWRIFNMLWALAVIITASLQCQPLDLFWEPLTEAEKYVQNCKVDIRKYLLAVCSIAIVVDVAIIMVPMVQCWNLFLNTPTRVLLCGVFATSFISTIISGVRIKFIHDLHVSPKEPLDPLNATWAFAYVGLWSLVDEYIAILSACLPCLLPVLVKLMPQALVPRLMQKGPSPDGMAKRSFFDSTSAGARTHPSHRNWTLGGDSKASMEKDSSALELDGTSVSRQTSADRAATGGDDNLAELESGIMEVAPGALASSSWLNVPVAQGPTTYVQAGGRSESRQEGILVEHSFEVLSERNTNNSTPN